MAALDLFSLQLSLQLRAGGGDGGEPALLALPDGAPWEIPRGAGGEAGAGAGAASGGKRTGDLGARGFGGRGAGGGWLGGGTAAALAGAQDICFHDYRYRPGAGSQTLWRREGVLLPHGLWVCDPSVPAGAASANGRACRDGVLAKLHTFGA